MTTRGRFKVQNSTNVSASRVRILLAFTKQSLRNAAVLDSPEIERPAPSSVVADGNQVEITWDSPVIRPGEEVEFTVETDCWPILIVHTSWFPDNVPSWPPPEPEPDLGDGQEFFTTRPQPVEVERPPCDKSSPVNDTVAPQQCDCKDFFAKYDARSLPTDVERNPEMTTEEKKERIATVRRMIEVLLARRNQRAADAKNGLLPDPDSLPKANRDDTEHLSEVQLELFRECFPDGKGGIDYAALQICFEKFSNGELRNPAKPGEREPDGGFFYLFAEFAFLAIAQAVSPAEWKQMLKTFVKCQEIFEPVYRPGGAGEPGLDDYKATNFRKTSQVDEEKKKRLRKKYDKLSPGELEREAQKNMKHAQTPRVFR